MFCGTNVRYLLTFPVEGDGPLLPGADDPGALHIVEKTRRAVLCPPEPFDDPGKGQFAYQEQYRQTTRKTLVAADRRDRKGIGVDRSEVELSCVVFFQKGLDV